MERGLDEILADFEENAPLEEAWTIPSSWYVDGRVEALEKRAVLGGTWQVVGRVAQVARPGELFTAEVAGERIVVVRGHDDVVRAFYNVCRHHAAAVVTEPSACVERLRCPYHGWTYGLDGKLKSTPEFAGTKRFDKADHGLVPVNVAVWEHFVLVNLDERATPLEQHLGKLIEQVAPLGISKLTFVERREYVLSCNWKVFVDNYLDGGYHIPYLHRGLNSILPFHDYTIETFDRFCLQSSTIDGSAGDEMTAQVRKGRALYYWVYPNFMLNWYEGYLDTNLVIPLGIDRTKVIFDFYFDDASEGAKKRNQDSMAVSERIQDEDHAICESVQRGLGSRSYRAGRLSARREAGENLFHRLLAHDLRRAPRNG